MTTPTQNPNVKTYTADDVRRLKDLIREGCQVLQEIEDLRTSLNDTIKAIAEEVDVKPAQLKKAVNIAHKRTLDEERAKFEEVEDILETVGVI
jgi:phage host-nuclease inhibitor protein Gam